MIVIINTLLSKFPIIENDIIERKRLSKPFLKLLEEVDLRNSHLYIKMTIFVLSANNLFDAHARILLRNLKYTLRTSLEEYLAVEQMLTAFFFQFGHDKLTHNIHSESKKGSKYMRYAKIGAASLGAGALLAVTGGLAAPAIAAAVVVIGGATATAGAVAAGMASTVVMGTLFGTAGAGLTGYKMTRRTAGVNEFEFEHHNPPGGQLAVIIMVNYYSYPIQLSFRLYLILIEMW